VELNGILMLSPHTDIKPTMLISIIIVNWNSESHLAACLDSIRGSVFPDNVETEIIVIDNCSADNSEQCAKQAADVIFIQSSTNLGFAAANNAAIRKHAKGDWVLFLNPDVVLEKNCLSNMIRCVYSQHNFDGFGATLVNSNDRTRLDGAGDIYHISGLAWRDGHDQQLIDEVLNMPPYEVFSCCAAVWLLRRSVFIASDGFDESFFCYQEDVDLGFRLRLQGLRFMQVPSAVAFHVGSFSTGGHQSDFSTYHGQRNMVWCFAKNMPGILFWICLPLHVFLNFFAIAFFALRGKGHLVLLAKWHALKELPRVLIQRKQIQSMRISTVADIWGALDKNLWPLEFKSLRSARKKYD
jgi:GT2 family glycosyltransferase